MNILPWHDETTLPPLMAKAQAQTCECGACSGACPTPEACHLPIAQATRPPRGAFWLHRTWVRLQIALLRWNFHCIGDERRNYQAAGMVGSAYLLESFNQQIVLMARIRELEAQL